jgi:hypothetical protein
VLSRRRWRMTEDDGGWGAKRFCWLADEQRHRLRWQVSVLGKQVQVSQKERTGSREINCRREERKGSRGPLALCLQARRPKLAGNTHAGPACRWRIPSDEAPPPPARTRLVLVENYRPDFRAWRGFRRHGARLESSTVYSFCPQHPASELTAAERLNAPGRPGAGRCGRPPSIDACHRARSPRILKPHDSRSDCPAGLGRGHRAT